MHPTPPQVVAAKVRLDRITFHPLNTRRNLGDLRDLTASITRYGILQPVTVEKRGDLLRLRAGHRRTAAARLAGLSHAPALVHAHALDDDEFVLQALHENIVRRGLDHHERRVAIRQLLELGCTPAGIARDLGVDPRTVQNWAADPDALQRRRGTRRRPIRDADVIHLVEQWEPHAHLGLTPDETQTLLDHLRKLVDAP